MPPPRFQRRNATMRRRMGLAGWNNSRPWSPWSKSLTTMTIREGHNPGGSAGAVFHLPVNNWNDPLGDLDTLVAGTGALNHKRHPMNHDQAIADGYNIVQVLSWKAVIETNWIAAGNITNDYIVAYTFSQNEATTITLVHTTEAARTERLNILTSPRWTFKRYNAAPYNSFGKKITIVVDDVYAYCELIAHGSQVNAFGNGMMSHVISDTDHLSNTPVTNLFCTVVIMTESGLVMLVDSIHVTVKVTQKVRIMRDKVGAQDTTEGVPDSHA